MPLLIIGSRGMLGQALVQVFRDHSPLGWDRDDLDITNQAQTMEKIAAAAPEIIINAAAYTNVDQAETDQETAFRVNEGGVKNLAQAAKAVGATLVHYSTDYIFPGTKAAGCAEDEETGPPVNVYGESKLAGERALAASGAAYYLLRTAWLYGPGGKNFVDTMLALASQQSTLSVISDQHGSPTFTYDVAQATKEIVATYPPGIYHTVNTGQTTWYDFALKIFTLACVNVTVTPVTSAEFPRPAQRPRYSMLKNTRGPALRPWEDALDDYLKNYHDNPS